MAENEGGDRGDLGDQEPQIAFWSQLQQRKVFRVVVSYAVVSFVVIQIADATFEALSIPSRAIPWLLAAMFFIFPFVVTIAWLYEITPKGVVLDTRFRRVAKPLEITFIVSIFVVSIGFAITFVWLGRITEQTRTNELPTIAVLPFESYGPDESGYLGNGIADQLMRVLDGLKEFNVVGRTSSFYYGNRDLEPGILGQVLGADHLVEGSVTLDGSRVLVTAQLIKSDSSFHVWSETYERTLDNVIDLELEIANEIANSMSVALSGTSKAALAQPATGSPEAYIFFLRAKEYLRRPATRESLTFAAELFEKALSEDAAMISAEVGLCQAQLALYRVSRSTDVYHAAMATCVAIAGSDHRTVEAYVALGDLNRLVGNLDEAEDQFKAGLALDRNSVRGLQGLARVYQARGLFDLAETTFVTSIAAEPSWSFGHRGYGFFLARQNRFEEAAAQFLAATELTPDDTNAYANLGLAYFDGGEWTKAEEAWTRGLAVGRTVPLLLNFAILRYYQKDYAGAIGLLDEARVLSPSDYFIFARLGAAERELGNMEHARTLFAQAIQLGEGELRVRIRDSELMASLASYYANVGDFDRADQYLAQAALAGPDDSSVPYFEAVVGQLSGRDGVAGALRRAVELGYPGRLIEVDPLFERENPANSSRERGASEL